MLWSPSKLVKLVLANCHAAGQSLTSDMGFTTLPLLTFVSKGCLWFSAVLNLPVMEICIEGVLFAFYQRSLLHPNALGVIWSSLTGN